MTAKVLAALLALAALVSMAANAPGRLPASGQRPLAATAGTNSHARHIADMVESGAVPADEGFEIAEWLDRVEQEMNAGRSAWSQFDFSTLELSIEASSRFNGDRTGDPSRAMFAAESLEVLDNNPEQFIRLAALGPLSSNQITDGPGQVVGAFNSLAGSARGSGGKVGGGATGDGSQASEGNQGSKPDGSAPSAPTVTEPTVTPPVSVPEPASMGLLGLGLISLGLARSRSRRHFADQRRD